MDVTRLNFADLYPTIESEIKECDYLAIDCEFSGIESQYMNLFDSQAERYSKKLKNEMKYDIVQFGLSIFKPAAADEEIKCACYNFYILKRHVKNSILPDYRMTVSTSAFEFLSMNNFDFNLLFKQGITYCTIEEEQRLKASFKRQDQELLISGRTDLSKQTAKHDALVKYNEFLNDPKQQRLVLGPFEKNKVNLVKATIDEAEKNRKNSPDTNLGLRSNGLELDVRILREGSESNLWKLELIKEVCKESFEFDYESIADESVGFSKVIQTIIGARKPIVGHNVLIDMMHIIHQFVAPLPAEYRDFQFITNELFPFVFDTKHMSVFLSSLNKLRVKSLQGLYNHFKNEYFSIIDRIKVVNSSPTSPDASVGEEDDEAQYHQAGYDSYITGSCFQVIRHLAEESSKKSVCNDTRFRNKFFNAWSYDIPYLSSEPKEDVQPDRNNVFFVQFKCEPFQLENQLTELADDCRFAFLDSESCLVGIGDKEAVKKIVDLKRTDSSLTILTYAEYKKAASEQTNQRPLKKAKIESRQLSDQSTGPAPTKQVLSKLFAHLDPLPNNATKDSCKFKFTPRGGFEKAGSTFGGQNGRKENPMVAFSKRLGGLVGSTSTNPPPRFTENKDW